MRVARGDRLTLSSAGQARTLHDAMAQLHRQLLQQRIEALQTRQRAHGLDEIDQHALRALPRLRSGARRAPGACCQTTCCRRSRPALAAACRCALIAA
ncbi:hypothetical protein [Xanthomonas arboricola]|uniref:hypothetical protein n=1 Tax=Xanthomonas arboricola TaxID=56448 RepID=UPI0015E360CF